MSDRRETLRSVFRDLRGRVTGLSVIRKGARIAATQEIVAILDSLERAMEGFILSDCEDSRAGLIHETLHRKMEVYKSVDNLIEDTIRELRDNHKILISDEALRQRYKNLID